jgi:hypothetical protein
MQGAVRNTLHLRYRVIALVLLVILTLGLIESLCLACADFLSRDRTVDHLMRAVKLDPWNGKYRAELADSLEYVGEDPEGALLRATELDPLNSSHWIRRGVRAEMQGMADAAEQLYQEAARVDSHFAPRITLMNFYFRQGEVAKFWKWSRLAFERSYGDETGAFDLCWRVSPNPGIILDRAIPRDNPALLQGFLRFASANSGDLAAAPVATELVKVAGPETAQALLEFCDRLILAGQFDQALEIWLGLSQRGLLRADAGRDGNLLANAGFRLPLVRLGFAWKWAEDSEVRLLAGDPPHGFSVSFTGDQRAFCNVLCQVVPVEPGRRYELAIEYRTASLPESGLSWTVENAAAPGERLLVEGLAPSDTWRSLVSSFDSGDTRFVRLTLEHRREPGAPRYEGNVRVRNLWLSRVTDER